MWEEVYGQKEYDLVSAEKQIRIDRKNHVFAGFRLGVDASALEELLGVREITIRTWLYRSGMQGRKLHERFMAKLELVHVQLDELWANVKHGSQDMKLWVQRM